MRGFDGVERAFQPIDDVRFRGDSFLQAGRIHSSGHFRSGNAEQIKISQGDMHVDFAGGTDTWRGTPREFFLRGRLGERDELAGNVTPFSVVALPNAFGLGVQAGGSQE